MKRISALFGLSFWLLNLTLSPASQAQIKKTEITGAINEYARYLAAVVLDEEGRSRCDYNMTEGKWYPYEVPWHTGQAINGLLAAYKVTGDQTFLDAAVRGGNYWISLEIKDESPLKGMLAATHGDFIGNEVIVFATISDGSPGIYELTRVTKDKKYAETATSAASWMLENMYYPEEGVCYDNVDIHTGKVLKESSPFWEAKDKKDQQLSDVSRPNTEGSIFKDAYEFSGREAFKDAFINLCNSLIEKQGPEGLWMQYMPNFIEDGSFHPRFNLWYAESLIEAFKLTGNKKYLEAAAKTARTFVKAQQSDGTIYYRNYIDGKEPDRGSVCGSAVAFAGIVWIELARQGYAEFEAPIELSAEWILHNHYDSDHPDPNLRGSALETRVRHRKGKVWMVNRDIATSFSVRFLADYLHYKFDR